MDQGRINQLANCLRCGQLFVKVQQSICPACIEKREQDFGRCREYLRDNPETRMKELAGATGVPVQQIIQFIIEGRLIITTANPNLFYKCERCGNAIQAGRLCAGCQQQFGSEVQQLVQKNHETGVSLPHARHSYRINKREN